MSELLPCPFCGSPARTVLNMDDVETWAQCTKRKPSRCPMSSTIIPIAEWNKRPAQQPAAAPVSGDVAQITQALEIGLESALDLFSDEPRATISELAERVDTIHAAIRALKEGK